MKNKVFRVIGNLFTGEGTVAALFNEWERKAERLTGRPGVNWTGKESKGSQCMKPDGPKRDK